MTRLHPHREIFRLRVMLLSVAWLAVLVLYAGYTLVHGQSVPKTEHRDHRVDSNDIVNGLASDGVAPPTLVLKPAERTRAIRLLLVAKRDKTGLQKQLAIYLLATLGQDYERNRDELLHIWHGCVVNDWDHGCDENTADLLMKLYNQGHRELLRQLLAGARHSDGALSEELFPFYAEQLEHRPKEFLAALSTFPDKEQTRICERVGWAISEQTGGGPLDGTYPKLMRTVLGNLKVANEEASGRCSRGVRKGYRDGVAAIIEEEKGPQNRK